jgi:hypothetical protein
MPARKDEISASEAARLLEIHERTVRRWVRGLLLEGKSRLRYGRIDVVGRYWVRKSDIWEIVKKKTREKSS